MRDFLFHRGFILPVVVTGVIPVVIVVVARAWERVGILSGLAGAAIWAGGFSLLVATTRLFAGHGGALAPWNPPTTLVLSGPYRYVRNPMISGIFLMLLGEAVLFRSPWLAGWFGLFLLAQFTYVHFDEEPVLRKRFGPSYEQYCREVPRWIPKLAPRREAASDGTSKQP